MSKLELIREMEERAVNSEHVRSLQTNVDLLNNELADVSSKLHEAAVELNKEKARNKSASQHSVVFQLHYVCKGSNVVSWIYFITAQYGFSDLP